MAKYNQVKNGSSGSDVKTLQELLNQNGYKLDADGIFGSNTLKAVRDFQKKNGLTVDGIVGNNTWSALTKSTSPNPTNTENTTTKPTTFTADPYEKSDAVKQAEAMIAEYQLNKPGDFSYTQQAGWDDIYNQIMNREDFTYDLNSDALYQQYKDQYTLQGLKGMMDTMGQAQEMTGGYGNTYAQTAGQQTYQAYLQQLNDRVPELYQLALDQYNQEGQDLYNQYALHADQYQKEYGEHRDAISDYYTELQRLTEDARYMSEDEYNKYLNELNLKYDNYWKQTEFDEAKRQYEEALALSSSTKNSSTYNGPDGGTYTPNPGWDEETIRQFQAAHPGLEVDGKWGPKTAAAYDKDKTWKPDGPDPEPEPVNPTAADYSDWDAGMWEGYFAQIRQSEGKAAAEEELKYFTSNGLIPKNMVTYAASGARGGKMGH